VSRFPGVFARHGALDEGLFVPFVVLGDPGPEASLRVIEALIEAGADALELGLPFSDPPADGPVIQAASLRALAAGMTTARALELVAAVRRRHDLPISLLGYLNPLLRLGLDEFYRRAAAAGVDAMLVADVPLEEAAPLLESAQRHGVDPVLIASERTGPERLDAIARRGRGYLYAVAHAGVTGERADLAPTLAGALAAMRARVPLPILAGFGISTPSQARAALDAGAHGVLCGSAVVRRIAERLEDQDAALAELRSFVAAMKAATRPHQGEPAC
jgi:tryptophan synthase alpha chain